MITPALVYAALAVLPPLGCSAIAIVLLARSRNAGRGRGPALVAALFLVLYGVLGVTHHVLRIIHSIVLERPGGESVEGTPSRVLTDNVVQPVWTYSSSALIALVVLFLIWAMIRSRADEPWSAGPAPRPGSHRRPDPFPRTPPPPGTEPPRPKGRHHAPEPPSHPPPRS
ncbi:hypothetical protein [Nocardiopsis sp. NPDC006832]|uniref:hypothetical protein n=1 Tax=Nocardiopsis sp. NPDC006832 TaxID=3157188 RepID=UPI0033C60933